MIDLALTFVKDAVDYYYYYFVMIVTVVVMAAVLPWVLVVLYHLASLLTFAASPG